MEAWLQSLLTLLALPKFGLSTVFVVALVSATLLPLGSEPAVFGLVKLNAAMFWPAILVATAGNTVGGAISWAMGYGAERAYERVTHKQAEARALKWLERFGAKACLLSWLPVVGDPLCAVAGWLRLPFWPCVFYMAIGKFARYLVWTALLLWWFPGQL
ncbi:YqaA family protein [Piscinibacter sp.]|uniref:YqaA family protein n=1 Tax=Piscinibacter sp. TaxID=1903157 RepID=UPI0039E50273